MCGIVGGTVAESEIIKSLSYTLRGNDGVSTKTMGDNICLGFQRHAIIAPDDSNSMQPVFNNDNTVALVFNGEIFNYKKYRKVIEKTGHEFVSKGDAEVLLQLYIQDIDKFYQAVAESMCTVGIYDARDKNNPKAIITRDWIGEMPLHYIYNKTDRFFMFASEIKNFIPVENYDIDKVESLEPGTTFELNLIDFSCNQIRYDYCCYGEGDYHDLKSIGKTLNKLLTIASKERLIADVPICCMLSGGVDSIVTTYLIKKALKENGKDLALYCFHIKDEPITPSTDLYHARRAASALGLGSNLREVYATKQEIIDSIPEVIYALEDKRSKDFNIYTAIYNFFLAKQITKDGYKVAFNGEGSDEFHGSYGSWGSFEINPNDIIKIDFRKKMASNLHKGVLQRTSKVMMYAGPIEMRSLFLSPNVGNYIINIPPQFLRNGMIWKMPLVEAFKKTIPEELLSRPKERPQDATGIMLLKDRIIEKYSQGEKSDKEIFERIFREKFTIKKDGLKIHEIR